MATYYINHMPPPVPGLTVQQLDMETWEVKGSRDALDAAGVPDQTPVKPMRNIAWPSGTKPFPFQQTGVDQLHAILTRHGGAILADEMGLGKTAQAAMVARALGGRTLVVCPASVRHQWCNWLSKVQPLLRGVDLGPPSQRPRKSHPEDPDFAGNWAQWLDGRAYNAVTSYALMGQALATKPKPTLIIFDEIHNFLQGRGNKYVEQLWKVAALVPYKLGVTGSPLVSKPAGLWQILNILLGMRFGRAKEFDVRYCLGHDDTGGWWNNKGVDKETAPELARRLSHYMVRRMKADVAKDMPKVTRVVRWIDGTPAARGAMARMAHTTHGMRQAMDPTLHGKIGEVVKLAQEASAPTGIFCWRRTDCEAVASAMDDARLNAMVIHGEYDASTRAAMIRQAQARSMHVITTYGASGTGLDGLQHFISHAIFHAIDPSPSVLLQAIARFDRIGQKLPVTATVTAMRDSVDEIIVDRVWERLDTFQTILGKDVVGTELAKALQAGSLGGGDRDAIMQAIFDEMTKGGTNDGPET